MAAAAVIFVCLQWREMRTGSADTHDLAEQAKTQTAKMAAALAKTDALIETATAQAQATAKLATAAGIQAAATRTLAEQAHRSADLARQSMENNKTSSYRDLRPYVQVTKVDFMGDILKGDLVKGRASVINSGRTPAVNVNGCGTIVLRPKSDPMTDDFPCIVSATPTEEHSRFALGSGAAGFAVDSPGTSIMPIGMTAQVFKQFLSSGNFRIYFYGYIEYGDLIDTKAIHHTTFCGWYVVDTGMAGICEKHNRAD